MSLKGHTYTPREKKEKIRSDSRASAVDLESNNPESETIHEIR